MKTQIVKKTSYIASDGKEFDNYGDAQNYERFRIIVCLCPRFKSSDVEAFIEEFDDIVEQLYQADVLGCGTVSDAFFGRREDF